MSSWAVFSPAKLSPSSVVLFFFLVNLLLLFFELKKKEKDSFNGSLGFLLILNPQTPDSFRLHYQMAFISSFRRVLGSSSASSFLQSNLSSIRHNSTLTSPKLFISGASQISYLCVP